MTLTLTLTDFSRFVEFEKNAISTKMRDWKNSEMALQDLLYFLGLSGAEKGRDGNRIRLLKQRWGC